MAYTSDREIVEINPPFLNSISRRQHLYFLFPRMTITHLHMCKSQRTMCGRHAFHSPAPCRHHCLVNHCARLWVCHLWFFETVAKNARRRKLFLESFTNTFVHKCVHEWVYTRVGVRQRVSKYFELK